MASEPLGVWFPAVRAGTGADVFTERLSAELASRGVRTAISWLPHRAEFFPWSVVPHRPPSWADVVHINSWMPQWFLPGNLPVVTTLHSCIHDPALSQYKNMAQLAYHRYWIYRCEAASIRNARVVTAVSHYAAKQAEQWFSCPSVIAIPNWVDSMQFVPANDQPVPHRPFRLLFVGKMSEGKGIDLLPSIMQRLGPDFQLAYTGTAESFGNIDRLPANMIALGRLHGSAALIRAYQQSDALLFPTRFEGFGLVALEAMACGVPVIATDCSALPEVVENGVSGILCPRDDLNAFVAAAQRLRNEPNLCRSMSLAARHRAVTVFTPACTVNRYLEIYRQLAGK